MQMKITKYWPIVLCSAVFCFLFTVKINAAKVDRILPQPMEGAEYIGMDSCVVCHDKEAGEFKRSTHAKFAIKEKEALGQDCESCHGPGGKHNETAGKQPGLILSGKDPQMCYTCHLEMKAAFNLQYHHPVPEGKVTCIDCHEPHSDEVKPWTATTLEGVNEKCFKCHPDKQGPFVWEHEAVREGCTMCHNPHGSINQSLLVARGNILCIRCHFQQNYPSIGTVGHTNMVTRSDLCTNCHGAIHGSNFTNVLRNVEY